MIRLFPLILIVAAVAVLAVFAPVLETLGVPRTLAFFVLFGTLVLLASVYRARRLF